MTAIPRVVIVGGGFGGLEAAKRLAGKRVRVLLIDRNNYHLFTPLLYQVASSLLNPSDIARPIRSIFRGRRNVRFRQATVRSVDFGRRRVVLDGGEGVPYDYLVLAAGSTTNYFGLDGAEQQALGLKDLPEALELRNHILRCLEHASTVPPDEAVSWLTFVVVGGGPTGVEYAGALSELAGEVLPREYPEIERRRVRIVLVEGLPEVLPPFPPRLQKAARRALEGKGIEVITGQRVVRLEGDDIVLANGDRIAARTMVWAAGVKPAELAFALDASRSKSGRVTVDRYLRSDGRDDVFVVGDMASFVEGGREVPMLSAPAMQEARVAADNILRSARGEPLKPFHYRDKGSMATIGKNQAVAQFGPVQIAGFVGWVIWLAVHLYYIIGFRNRFVVLVGWAWDYIRSDRPVRIIARARERER